MVNGNAVNVQFGTESTFGTKATPTVRDEVSSETMSYTPEKSSEGLLTGKIGGSKVETMQISAGGTISTLAKPINTGFYLKHVFGVETVADGTEEGTYVHTFTPVGNGEADFLPSVTFTIDRKVAVLAYTGQTATQITFSAAPGERLTIETEYVGKAEEPGVIVPALAAVSRNETAFKFHHGAVSMDNVKVADITNISFAYNNNCDNTVQTTDTGLYHKQPQPGTREATATLEAVYTTAVEAIRTGKFKTDAIVSLEVGFEDADGNSLVITLPAAQISEMANPTATGAETMKQSLTVTAISGDSNFAEAVLTNTRSEAY